MEDRIFEQLEKLDINDTDLLLKENINLSLDRAARKRIERIVNKKAGYYKETYTLIDKINNILGGLTMKRKIALVLGAAFVLTLGGGGYAYAKTPVAYVSLDINPSVELGVNGFDQVVSAEAYNEDGEKVLEGTNLVNTNVDQAVSTVISNAITDGYIKEDGSSTIEITTSTDKENVASDLEESLKETAGKTLEDKNVEATVETENVALARRDEARQLGITPGKLNLIQKLQKLDPTIKVEDYKESSVKDIMKKAKELRKNANISEVDIEGNVNAEVGENNNLDKGIDVSTDSNIGNDAIEKEEALSKEPIDSKGQKNIKAEKNNEDNKLKEENNGQKDNAAIFNEKERANLNSQGNDNSSQSEKSNNSNSHNKNKNN